MKPCPRCGYIPGGKQRSNPENRYYWGVVVQILAEELGYFKDEMHEILKRKFLTEHVLLRNKGKEIAAERNRSTAELSTKEMEDFLSQIRIWASSELSIFIPEPNEVIND